MARYILCPRCELNYIDADVQEYCDVCVKEMQGAKTFSDDLEEVDLEEETELCPVCGENYMRVGEKMCDECKKKSEYVEEPEEDPDKDEAWRSYIDDDTDETAEMIPIPDADLDGDEEEEEEKEITSKDKKDKDEDDDFEYVSADDYNPDEDDEDEEDPFDDDDAPVPKSGSKKKRKIVDDDDDF